MERPDRVEELNQFGAEAALQLRLGQCPADERLGFIRQATAALAGARLEAALEPGIDVADQEISHDINDITACSAPQ
jgi:hypothetical protein